MANSSRRASEPLVARRVIPASSVNPPRRSSFNEPNHETEVLFNHKDTKIVALTAVNHIQTVPSPERSDTAPLLLSSERTIAVGQLTIYRALGSVAFLKCGTVLQPIMPRSQCWAISEDDSKFILQVRRPTFWRIELPSTTQDELLLAQGLPRVLDHILRYEKTPCPLPRSFTTKQTFSRAELSTATKRPWTPVNSALPVDYSRILDSSLPPTQVLGKNTTHNLGPTMWAADTGSYQILETNYDEPTTATSNSVEFQESSTPGGLITTNGFFLSDLMSIKTARNTNVSAENAGVGRKRVVISADIQPELHKGTVIRLPGLDAKLKHCMTTEPAAIGLAAHTAQASHPGSPSFNQKTVSKESRRNSREYSEIAASGEPSEASQNIRDLLAPTIPRPSSPSTAILHTEATRDHLFDCVKLPTVVTQGICNSEAVMLSPKQCGMSSDQYSTSENRRCSLVQSRGDQCGIDEASSGGIQQQITDMKAKHNDAQSFLESNQPGPSDHGRLVSQRQQPGRSLSPLPPAATIFYPLEQDTSMTHLIFRGMELGLALAMWSSRLMFQAIHTLLYLSVDTVLKLGTSDRSRVVLSRDSSGQTMGTDWNCSDSDWEYDWTDADEQDANEAADNDDVAL